MRAGLELRLGQQLRLSPQLRQALKLLQMSQAELEIELREQVESNPVLDLGDGEAEGGADEDAGGPGAEIGGTVATVDSGAGDAGTDTGGSEDAYDGELDYSPEPGEGDWGTGGGGGDAEGDPVDWAAAPADDLAGHLLWQLRLSPASDSDRAIAVALIESLEPDGYLRVDLEDIQATLAPELVVSVAEIEAVRHRLQRFDPVGVASRDLRDCLLVQLDALPDREDPVAVAARRLVDAHLEKLPRTERAQLARLAECDETTLAAALDLIRSLDPKPGGRLDASAPEYVQPDVYAVREQGRWRVALPGDQGHQLRINRDYLRMAREAGREARSYLRGCLQEARWLMRALEQRQDTLYRVASAIVRAQEAFLEQGPQAMRPLMLKDIAAELDIHESTVSRTVARKYLHTPRGVYELRHFFSTGYAGGEDGDAAATAVRALIGELIAAEDPARPLSDQALAGLLKQRGLNVARRTVAKYREQLRLAPSHERRRAG